MSANPLVLLSGLALALAASAVQAAGTVSVRFIAPEHFADARDARRDASDNLRLLAAHIESAAGRHLADGDKLSVEVLDVDLAGEIRPSARWVQDVRVLRGSADWPSIKLRYTLDAAGQPPLRGEATLSDMAYLQRTRAGAGDPLVHERRMLDDFFRTRLPATSAR